MTLVVHLVGFLQRSSHKGKLLLVPSQHSLSQFSVFLCLVIPSIFCRPKRDMYEHFFWQLTV